MNSISTTIEKLAGKEEVKAILNRIYFRISAILTDYDIEKLKELDAKDVKGNVVEVYLLSRMPNLHAIIREEAEKYNKGKNG